MWGFFVYRRFDLTYVLHPYLCSFGRNPSFAWFLQDETPIVPEVPTSGRKSSVIKFQIGEHDKEDEWEDDDQEQNTMTFLLFIRMELFGGGGGEEEMSNAVTFFYVIGSSYYDILNNKHGMYPANFWYFLQFLVATFYRWQSTYFCSNSGIRGGIWEEKRKQINFVKKI